MSDDLMKFTNELRGVFDGNMALTRRQQDLVLKAAALIESQARELSALREVVAKGIPFSHSDTPEGWRGMVELMFPTAQDANEFAELVMQTRAALAQPKETTNVAG